MSASDVPFSDIRKNLMTFALPILFLFFLAIFVPTNAIGSGGLVLVLILVLWRETELRNRWSKIVWPWLLVVLIYFLIMSTYAFSRATAVRDGIEVLKGIALSVVALSLLQLSDRYLRRSMEYVVLVLLAATMAIVTFNLNNIGSTNLIGHGFDWYIKLQNQGFDWYVNRNRLAVGFSIVSILIAALMVEEKARLKSFLLSTAWIFMAVAAVLNASRGAVVGMIIATACILLAGLLRAGWRQVFRIEVWALPIIFVVMAIVWVCYSHFSVSLVLLHHNSVSDNRTIIWHTVGERALQAPWFGFGPHAMKYDPMVPSQILAADHPHDIYLGLFYASGLFGVLFWLIWFFSFSFKIRKNFTAKNEVSYYIGMGLLVNILIHGLVDFDFYMFSIFTYITVGLVLLLPKFAYKE